ncbi:NAD(P)-binding protein [Diplocarpon rosae]|nr:NAD(P)-binding protein [Diplocarpon rosae]
MAKHFLVTGATGKQGGAVIDALLSSSQNATIFALTRNTQSKSAQALALKAPDQVKLLPGDLKECSAIFSSVAVPIDGVFCVSIPAWGFRADPNAEEAQGRALIDAAIAHGVRHFVYTSVDRHGSDSDENTTDVPHFISKANIEKHLIARSRTSQMSWSILRPTAFMDNIVPGFAGKIFPTAWKVGLSPGTKLQLVSTADIGYFGAQALLRPTEYASRAISLAGDELTFEEANAIFVRGVGHDVPQTFAFLGRLLLWVVKDVGLMFKFFEEVGYSANIEELRGEYPGLRSLEDWLQTSEYAPNAKKTS